jgi:hypothetical protein
VQAKRIRPPEPRIEPLSTEAKDLFLALGYTFVMQDIYIGKGKLAGKGVYAARNFKEGELVKQWNLKPITQEDFDALPKSEHMFVHTFNGKLFLFPEPSRYTNHSSNPTVRSDFEKQCDYAIRPIKKGEPITINANLEVQHELETFVVAHEKAEVTDFEWLSGGYRNAVVRYKPSNGHEKTLVLRRIRGNWRVLDEK